MRRILRGRPMGRLCNPRGRSVACVASCINSSKDCFQSPQRVSITSPIHSDNVQFSEYFKEEASENLTQHEAQNHFMLSFL
nr:unnamed protein product [Spirometra erinaceieuropaei]